MRNLFWLLPILAILGLSIESCSSPTDSPTTLTYEDVFPLSVGRQFTYSYFSHVLERDGYPLHAYLDSGWVAYRIVDSVVLVQGSAKQWAVEETRHLLHKEYSFPDGVTAQLIYSQWQDTTETISVLEQLDDLHEIISMGLVWNFPLSDSLGSPATWIQTFRCNRYADSAPVKFIAYHSVSSDAVVVNDTVSLEIGVGLTSRMYHQDGWAMSAWNITLMIQLIPNSDGFRRP